MPRVVAASDSSLLVEFGHAISPEFYEPVLTLFRALLAERDSRIRNLHPAYASLLIDFDPLQITHKELAAHVGKLIELVPSTSHTAGHTITIPVCYDPEFGLDLGDVAAHNSLSVEDVIRLHTSASYLVYFLGFSPGFAYLGGLPAKLRTPRLASPRSRVAAGSVGIAGDQTGVYPVDSAGGWRLIGRTPLRMFDASASSPTLLQAGESVRFQAIDRLSYDNTLTRNQ
jgi:inhibitor of KinA